MGSFYELTEEDIKLLLEALDLWRTDGKFWTDEEVELFETLYHYLKTREVK
jgi:hypothetical protein